ncbi:MAG: hypothetical protein ACOY94_06825 [Bacillota bacterium]
MAEFLTRAFFEEELDRLSDAYGKETGDRGIAVMVMLRDGQALKLEGKPTCTDTYLLCDYKSRGVTARAAVPYGSIVAVSLTSEVSGTMGFNR